MISGKSSNKEPETENYENMIDEYVTQTENKLQSLISSIEGAGETKIMITIESGEENIYARDINSEKSEYVVIKSNSVEGGMLLKTVRPEIRGVAVVCEGGDNAKVRIDIINAVCSSLGVSSAKISIAKMKVRGD